MFLLVVQTASNPPTVSGLLVSKPPRAASRAFHRLLGVGDSHAHGAGGTLDHAHRGLDVGGVQVGHLLLSDLADLRLRELANLGLVGLALSRPETVGGF